MKKLMAMVLLAVVALLAGPEASAANIKCNACTEAAYKQRATLAGTGTHNVYDLYFRRVSTFQVNWDAERRVYEAIRIPSDSKIVTLVDALSDIYAATGGSMNAKLEVEARDLGYGSNAYDAYGVLNDRNLRIRIGDMLGQRVPPGGNISTLVNRAMDAYTAVGITAAGLNGGTVVYVTVKFSDGSKADFKITLGVPKAEYVPGSGRSPSGDGLLEANTPEFAGTYRFGNGSELLDFLNQARLLGISITGSGGEVWQCHWNGQTMHCTRTR